MCGGLYCGVRSVMAKGHLIVDDSWRIVREYQNNVSRGQPRAGSVFIKWAVRNHFNPSVCTRVKITPKVSNSEDYEEFPGDLALATFDPADRKFVAVAAAHPGKPQILQASDSKWWGAKDALAAAGLKVTFLCQEDIAATHRRKSGRK